MKTEELKEMINSTLASNGNRQISAGDLRNALIEIITAAAEGGAKRTKVYLSPMLSDTFTLTAEEQAANAEVYAAIKDAFDNNGDMPMLEGVAKGEIEGTTQSFSFNPMIAAITSEGVFQVLLLGTVFDDILLNEDGSLGSASGASLSTLNLSHNG